VREDAEMTDELSFDRDAFELRCNGAVVDLEPQAVSVAAYLIEHRHRLISKEELLDEVWGDRFVSESALTTRIKQIRKALGDSGSEQRVVKTVHGKGYRFVADISTDAAHRPQGARAASGGGVAAASERPVHQLPNRRAELIGRGPDLDAVLASVGRHRLTTMVGVGGVGKTTLAVAAGHALLESFANGVFFVDLARISDGDHVAEALAKTARLSLRTGPVLDQIAGIIEHRDMLLILDNCEHVLESVASVVDHLLDATTGPRFLLTSREPSALPDEARVVIDTLSTAHADGPAVELMELYATRFGVADLDRTAAAAVCRDLDGLPLAIELAAAQLRHLSLDDLAARLDGRFDLLVAPRRDRHASLGAVLDATWASISEHEREVLRQLAVCPGPLGLDDLIEVMAQPEHRTIAAIGRLVDCSLLTRSAGTDGSYRMLETVRMYARDDDRDGESARRDRLADWCLERVGTDVLTHAFDFELTRWCRSHDDILDAAETHLVADRPYDAALLVAAQGLARHVDDGSRAAAVLSRLGDHLDRVDDPGLRARLHITGTYAAMAARDAMLLASHGAAAVTEARRADDPAVLAISLVLSSWSLTRSPDRAAALVAEAAQVAEQAGNRRAFDLAEGYRAWHLMLNREYDQAIEVAGEVVARAPEDAGYDTYCAAAALVTCLAPGEPQRALDTFETYIDGSAFSSMMANELLLATVHATNGDIALAARIVLSVCRRLERAGVDAFPDALVPIAMIAIESGADDRAGAYVLAVRQSATPTQSLQATCLYQQLRQRVEHSGHLPAADDAAPVDEVVSEARAWLTELVGAS
jgi:predicted ATPase/DNA-binding winged helix-turn-helix (wHTH) protein